MRTEILNDALQCDGLLGVVKHTNTSIKTVNIIIELDKQTGLYLCDILDKNEVIKCPYLDRDQHEGLINLGLLIAPNFGHRISESEDRSIRGGVDCEVTIDVLTIELRRALAWALCNLLSADLINENKSFSKPQKNALIHLGAAVAAFHGHSGAMLRVAEED
ncbi:hypothetical protein OTK49_03450 [Vibrio coralliirubri]|uniref:hypothetical protein n=1 Tax=Vibrio coralliirubri TaxID=1516159 RepID=UPI002283C6C9|nr:hypothetical protein [Vibrio coralliirubri]MCY9861573.1 hypothetical protein [Vibrio coralliirubri]